MNFPLKYTAVRDDFTFKPLDSNREMSIREILEKHPKGREFGFILENSELYPMIIDSKGEAISFPPIINAEKTRVKEETNSLFIDVTGFDENVDKALNILATMFLDRGGIVEGVTIIYKYKYNSKNKLEETPNLSPKEMRIKKSEIFSLLGLKLSDEEIELALKRMRYGLQIEDEEIRVLIPPYRVDIMHEWDVIEDIAIGFGYDRITPRYPRTSTIGKEHEWNRIRDVVREIMLGLGFTEVITFTLTNRRAHYEYMNREAREWSDYTPLMQPLTRDHTILRTDILPKLLEVLSNNKHQPMPQRIFEVGDVVVSMKNRLRLAACITHAKANFAEMRSVVQAVMHELDLRWYVEESNDKAFIKGRRADIIVNGKNVGVFGELHPEVLERFEIFTPTTGFELDLTELFDLGEII